MVTQAQQIKQAISNAFSAVANTYDQAAIIEQEIGQRLMAKVTALQTSFTTMLDLGCGTGMFTQQLQQLYPSANITGLDLSLGMLNFATQKHSLAFCCADAEQLPFANAQFDLIFANCSLLYIKDLAALFLELQRVLTMNGAIVFSTFGPDTLTELGLNNRFTDMHIIGDLLLKLQFKNPIMETEKLNFQYEKLQTLCDDLHQSGTYQLDLTQLKAVNLPFNASFEVIYGIAHKQKLHQYKNQSGHVYVPIDQLTILK